LAAHRRKCHSTDLFRFPKPPLWTGHASRLNRDLKNRFGTKAYAAEELIAELTSAFLCAHLAIDGELRHASYIGEWIKLLKEDSRAIFTAASKASQAADFLRAVNGDREVKDELEPISN
jgi:antirestriction protein ArdC